MSVFELARMRHLDLLALWHLLHPAQEAGSDMEGHRLARVSKERLAAELLNSPA